MKRKRKQFFHKRREIDFYSAMKIITKKKVEEKFSSLDPLKLSYSSQNFKRILYSIKLKRRKNMKLSITQIDNSGNPSTANHKLDRDKEFDSFIHQKLKSDFQYLKSILVDTLPKLEGSKHQTNRKKERYQHDIQLINIILFDVLTNSNLYVLFKVINSPPKKYSNQKKQNFVLFFIYSIISNRTKSKKQGERREGERKVLFDENARKLFSDFIRNFKFNEKQAKLVYKDLKKEKKMKLLRKLNKEKKKSLELNHSLSKIDNMIQDHLNESIKLEEAKSKILSQNKKSKIENNRDRSDSFSITKEEIEETKIEMAKMNETKTKIKAQIEQISMEISQIYQVEQEHNKEQEQFSRLHTRNSFSDSEDDEDSNEEKDDEQNYPEFDQTILNSQLINSFEDQFKFYCVVNNGYSRIFRKISNQILEFREPSKIQHQLVYVRLKFSQIFDLTSSSIEENLSFDDLDGKYVYNHTIKQELTKGNDLNIFSYGINNDHSLEDQLIHWKWILKDLCLLGLHNSIRIHFLKFEEGKVFNLLQKKKENQMIENFSLLIGVGDKNSVSNFDYHIGTNISSFEDIGKLESFLFRNQLPNKFTKKKKRSVSSSSVSTLIKIEGVGEDGGKNVFNIVQISESKDSKNQKNKKQKSSTHYLNNIFKSMIKGNQNNSGLGTNRRSISENDFLATNLTKYLRPDLLNDKSKFIFFSNVSKENTNCYWESIKYVKAKM